MSENSMQFTARIAENYEKYLAPVFFISTSKDLVSHLKGSPENILEIAAGTGQVTRNLIKTFPEAKITATDINPGMLDVAKNIVHSENITWQAADACELPFENNSFDAIICQFGVMFFPDKQKAMNEAYRVLKPGGQIVFNTWDSLENNRICKIPDDVVNKIFPTDPPPFYKTPFSMYDPAEIEALLKTAGFNNIKIENKKMEGYSESPDNAVTAFTEGNPIYLQIMERDPAILPVFQKMLKEELIKEFGAGRFTIPLSEFIVTAKKYYEGWETANKELLNVSADLKFFSPDGNFSSAKDFLDQCWQFSGVKFQNKIILSGGDFVAVKYGFPMPDGTFKPIVEWLTIKEGLITEIQVFYEKS